MDAFYLRNVSWYQSLVQKHKTAQKAKPAEQATTAADATSPNMVVSARIRPLSEEDKVAGFPRAIFPRSPQAGVASIHDLYNNPKGKPILKTFDCEVDRLFDSHVTTEEIYDNLMGDLLPFAWNGGIGTLFAYGQTGSGKTFTISRLQQLAVETLMNGNLPGQRNIYMTIIEIAGNAPFDLLSSREPILILEDSFGVTQLSGAKEHLVQDQNEAMALIEQASAFRKTESTLKNDESSRSHSICRIRIDDPSSSAEDGILYLLDLAGSEVARDFGGHGASRIRETRQINMSLSVLKDCIRGKVLADTAPATNGASKRKPRVPFRQSALTKVLKHVFDPESDRACKTVVIACVNPSLADVGPSKNTLRYAELLRVLVPAEKSRDESMGPMGWTNEQLREWISSNSGTPSISASLLAPTQTGTQILRLQTSDFVNRCLKSPGVTIEQAQAFRSKLWQLHVDTQHANNQSGEPTPRPKGPEALASSSNQLKLIGSSCSRGMGTGHSALPFKDRIRPGMVVSWTPLPGSALADIVLDELKLAVVLCPASATGESVIDGLGNSGSMANGDAKTASRNGDSGHTDYLCALVAPGATAESYEVLLWRHIYINADMMEKEVFLEYDSGTRYYYISV